SPPRTISSDGRSSASASTTPPAPPSRARSSSIPLWSHRVETPDRGNGRRLDAHHKGHEDHKEQKDLRDLRDLGGLRVWPWARFSDAAIDSAAASRKAAHGGDNDPAEDHRAERQRVQIREVAG